MPQSNKISGRFWKALLGLLAMGIGMLANATGQHEGSQRRVIELASHPTGVWFVPNEGQWAEDALFSARVFGGDIWLTKSGFSLAMLGEGYDALASHETPLAGLTSYVSQVTFEGGAEEVSVETQFPSTHRVAYYHGSDPTNWAHGLAPAGMVRYPDVWPGIDWVMDGRRGGNDRVKYDWVLDAGADPEAISLRYAGTDVRLMSDGSLKHLLGPEIGEGDAVTGVWGHVLEKAPFAYQMFGTHMVEVSCAYRLEELTGGEVRVQFELGTFDPLLPLIIDPEIEFASFIGSTADSWGFTAAYDEAGRLIGGSGVRAAGYPTTPGAISTTFSAGEFDLGVSIFSTDGSTLEYSTYLGGNNLEYPHSLVTDATGDVYVMGTTGSADFPITEGAYQTTFNGGPNLDLTVHHFYGTFNMGCDIVISRISGSDGSLMASTFLGGSGNDGLNLGEKLNYNYGDPCRGEVVVDPSGSIWVATSSLSDDFPLAQAVDPELSGSIDAVICRLSEDLEVLQFSTYFGGNAEDAAFGIQFAAGGPSLAYVTGGTKSNDLPTTPGAYQPDLAGDVDAYILALDYGGPTPFISSATYMGSEDYDQAYFVQLDTDNRPYICGQTTGALPLIGDVYSDNPNGSTFIARMSQNLESMDWRTRIGVDQTGVDISPTAFLVSDCDEIYLSGWGGATNFANSGYAGQSTTNGMPTTAEDAFQLGTDGSDFWLGVLEPNAADLSYGTFFGGTFSDEHVDGGTSRFDKNGTVYQAVCAGCGGWDDFPTTDGAWSNTNGSTNCNLGVFKFNLGSLVADIEIEAPDLICIGDPIQFINSSIGGTNYEWFFGDLNSSDEENPEYIYGTSGEWEVTLIISDVTGGEGCLEPDTAVVTLFIEESPTPLIDEVGTICEGESVMLQAYGSEALQWQADPTLSDTDISNPEASPTETTTYIVEDSNECGAGTASVTVVVEVLETDITGDVSMCVGDAVQLEATGGAEVFWTPATGLGSPASATTTASPTETTEYTASIVSSAGCTAEEEVTVYVVQAAPGGQVYPTIYLCAGQGVFLSAAEGDSYLWAPESLVSNPMNQNPYVSPTENTTFYVSIANVCGVGIDSVSVELIAPTASASGGGWMCRGESMVLSSSEGISYHWSPPELVNNPTAQSTTVFPIETTTFTVHVTDEFGCTGSTELVVSVWQPPYVDAGPYRQVDWMDRIHLFGTAEGDTLWWSPAEDLSCSDCLTPEVFVSGPQWYVLQSLSSEGCLATDSVFVDVFYPVYAPNAFTPNNDGFNDAFFIEGVSPRGYRLEIFNRWGERMFYSEDPTEPWLGQHQRLKGSYFVPDGVYIWRLRYEMRDGPRIMDGTVTLIR